MAIPLPAGSSPFFRDSCTELTKLIVRVILRLAVYRQSVHLGAKPPLRLTALSLFLNLTLAVIALM
jgi:hypothetical protein